VWVGRVSYGIYIWHVLLAEIVVHASEAVHVHLALPLRALLWAAALLPTAAASHRWFELPVQGLREHFDA